MSYALRFGSRFLVAFAAFGLMACGGVGGEQELGESTQAATAEATVVFNGNFTTEVRGTLERGKRLRILYSADRAKCRSTYAGGPAWAVNAYYRWDGGEVRSVHVAGLRSDPTAPEPGIDLERTGQLEMWFQNTDRYGCNQFDSAFGQNYKFTVVAGGREPGWLGNAQFAIDRQTCEGGVCRASWRSLEGGFLYETWARQRAAVRKAGFEVWKAGVTDFDNANLWRELDVQVHRRYVGEAAFVTEYVSFDGRWGNNAHYSIDLRALDPFEYPRGANIRTAADCPKFTLRREPSGNYIEAELEFYFTVNGATLRPAAGGTFRGKYQDYLGNYAVCVN